MKNAETDQPVQPQPDLADSEGGMEEFEEPATKPVQKRTVTPLARQKMLENLTKAREQKAINKARLSKYPKAKRDRAKEMYEQDLQAISEEKMRLLAEELYEKRKQEEEFQQWKESKKKKNIAVDAAPEPRVRNKTPIPKKKAPAKKPPAAKKAKASAAETKDCEREAQPVYPPVAAMDWYSLTSRAPIDLSKYMDF